MPRGERVAGGEGQGRADAPGGAGDEAEGRDHRAPPAAQSVSTPTATALGSVPASAATAARAAETASGTRRGRETPGRGGRPRCCERTPCAIIALFVA
ncbi:MAG: hypothetical protein ACK559_04485 [bacterium]